MDSPRKKQMPPGWIKVTPRYLVIHLSRDTILSILQEWQKVKKGELKIEDSIRITGLMKKMRDKLA